MEPDFWKQAWDDNRIGFHLSEVNPLLARFYQSLELPEGSTVLVPLCGKSIDMLWLRDQGASVIGVEIAAKAIEDFFLQNKLEFDVDTGKPFDIVRTDKLSILHGSIFDLDRSHVESVGAVYDRAALIAFPPEMRKEYATLLCDIIPPAARILLVTIEYDCAEMTGPPFSLTDTDVRNLFAHRFHITLEEEADALPKSARFRERGATHLVERVYRLT